MKSKEKVSQIVFLLEKKNWSLQTILRSFTILLDQYSENILSVTNLLIKSRCYIKLKSVLDSSVLDVNNKSVNRISQIFMKFPITAVNYSFFLMSHIVLSQTMRLACIFWWLVLYSHHRSLKTGALLRSIKWLLYLFPCSSVS